MFVTGDAYSLDFPAAGPQLPSDTEFGHGAFITLLNSTGTAPLYSSRFGGSGGDVALGLSLSRFGTVAVVGTTNSINFPTIDAVQPALAGLTDAFISIISAPRIVTRLESPAGGGATRAASVTLRGWAADTRAVGGTGIDGIHIYAYQNGAGAPLFLGLATAGEQRDDVAAALGADFATSGFSLTTTVPPGDYLFVAFAHSNVTGAFGDPAIVRARAEAGAQLDLESTVPGPSNQSFVVSEQRSTTMPLQAPASIPSMCGRIPTRAPALRAVSRRGRLRRVATRARDRLRREVQERGVLARRNAGARPVARRRLRAQHGFANVFGAQDCRNHGPC